MKHNLYLLDFINSTTNHWCLCQAAEKFKAPQPAPAVPEAKAAAAEEEEEEEEEEVRLQVFHFNHFAEFFCSILSLIQGLQFSLLSEQYFLLCYTRLTKLELNPRTLN